MVASEGAIARTGWDYAAVLRALCSPVTHAAISPRDFGTHIVRHGAALVPPGELSLLDLEQSDDALHATSALIAALRQAAARNAADRRALSIVLRHVASVRVRQFIHLEGLHRGVGHASDPNVRQRADDVEAALRRFVLAGGVSIYYPYVLAPSRAPGEKAGEVMLDGFIEAPAYRQLDFVRESGWGGLLGVLKP